MAEKIKILELDLDTNAVIAKSIELKEKILAATSSLTEMKKAGQGASEEAIKLEATTKKLSAEYSNNQKTLVALTTANGQLITAEEKLSLLLNQEVVSIDSAKSSTSELIKVRNTLDLTTEKGIALQEEINKKINENDNFQKSNVSEREKNIMSVGGYTNAIKESASALGLESSELNSVKNVMEKLSGPIDVVKKGFTENIDVIKNAKKGTEDLSGAQKASAVASNVLAGGLNIVKIALAALGIGVILIVLGLLIGYFKTFDPLLDKIEQTMSGFGAAIRVVQQALVSFFANLKDIGDFFTKLGDFIQHPVDSLGKLADKMDEAKESAERLKAEQQDLIDAQAVQDVMNKKEEAQIARLMLQSRDRTKTEEERLAILKQAEDLTNKNFETNSKLAEKESEIALRKTKEVGALTDEEVKQLEKVGVAYAYKLLNLGKITQEEVDMITKAENSKIEVFNKSTAQLEKIQLKSDAIAEKAQQEEEKRQQKNAESKAKLLENISKQSKASLALFISEMSKKAKSYEEELYFAEQIKNKKIQIAQDEYNATKKTKADKLALQVALNDAESDLIKTQTEIVISSASNELKEYQRINASKIDTSKFITETILVEELKRLDGITQQQIAFENLRLERGAITEQEYQDRINEIKNQSEEARNEITLQRESEANEKKQVDLENELASIQNDGDAKLSIQLQMLEFEKANELRSAEKTGADKMLIKKKYAKLETDLRQQTELANLKTTADFLGQAASLFKENTLAFKLLAVSQALINTYVTAMAAYKAGVEIGGPSALLTGSIFAGIATAVGLATTAKVAGVKLAKGVINLQGEGTETSDSIPAMLSKGESVIPAKKTSLYTPLLNAIMNNDSPVLLNGVAYPTSILSTFGNQQQSNTLDYDLLATKISQANLNLPQPKLSIQTFKQVESKFNEIVTKANH